MIQRTVVGEGSQTVSLEGEASMEQGRADVRCRPLGVTSLALLNGLFGLLGLVLTGFVLTGGTQSPGFDAAMLGIVSSISVIVAVGLWRLRNWARRAALVLYAVSAGLGLLSLGFGDPSGLVRAGVAGGLAWYLSRPGVRMAFEALT